MLITPAPPSWLCFWIEKRFCAFLFFYGYTQLFNLQHPLYNSHFTTQLTLQLHSLHNSTHFTTEIINLKKYYRMALLQYIWSQQYVLIFYLYLRSWPFMDTTQYYHIVTIYSIMYSFGIDYFGHHIVSVYACTTRTFTHAATLPHTQQQSPTRSNTFISTLTWKHSSYYRQFVHSIRQILSTQFRHHSHS